MNNNIYKDIFIGKIIKSLVQEQDISMERILSFLDVNEASIVEMFSSKSLDSEILLRWSKLLKYDLFRIYSHHIVLYSPSIKHSSKRELNEESEIPSFKKNLYTPEIIEFIVDKVQKKEKTAKEIILEYRIPKTTLYKWLEKYRK